jgi:putative transposase
MIDYVDELHAALPKSAHPAASAAIKDIYNAEETFATVRLRTKVTKGPGSRAAGIAMAYMLIDAAQARWQAVNAHTWSPWSVPGRCSTKGKLLERPIDIAPPEPTESTGTEVA